MEDARAFVELSIDRGVAVATLNRPEVRNAVDERIRAGLPLYVQPTLAYMPTAPD